MDWVIDKYYYIINFKRFLQPRIYPVYFTNRFAAKRAIQQNVPGLRERIYYEIISGKKLKDFEATYVLRLGRLGKFTKYAYPKDLRIRKKTYRTMIRRRLRRMGMLSLPKNKYRIGQFGIVKYIENHQEVANTPNTSANAFRIERKGTKWYYLIIKKKLSKKKGFLFRVKALRVNIKTKEITKLWINLNRKDILIPYLFTEITKLYGSKDLLDRCRKEGIRVYG